MIRRSFLLALSAVAAGCRDRRAVLCFAAASTSEPLTELGRAWGGAPGSSGVRFSWGSSGDLARQLVAGAPADLFLSADAARVELVERAGLLSSRRDLLSNRLVVIVKDGGPEQLASARALASLRRIAIGDPASVPAGTYAKQWLERAGAYDVVAPRLVPTLDARAAVVAVETGSADAAIVYRTDALLARRARIALEPADQPRIVYPLAVLSRASAPARAFAEHLASPEGRAVFARYGFTAP